MIGRNYRRVLLCIHVCLNTVPVVRLLIQSVARSDKPIYSIYNTSTATQASISYRSLSSNLHIPPSRNPNRLTTDIRKQRRRNPQNRPGRLLRARRAPQRNIRIRILLLHLARATARKLLARDPQRHLGAVRRGDERAGLLRRRQPRLHEPKRNRVGPHPERRAPFFSNRLGQPDHPGFSNRVVHLAAVDVSRDGYIPAGRKKTYALPWTPLVELILITTRGSPSLTRKYGAAARTSLNGAVLCTASIVSHCLSVIYPTTRH